MVGQTGWWLKAAPKMAVANGRLLLDSHVSLKRMS
jgi:hypothetical protein